MRAHKYLLSTVVLSFFFSCAIGQDVIKSQGNNIHKIYDHEFNPVENPDYSQKWVNPPTWETFGNRTHFISLRDLSGDYKKKLDDYTVKFKLGDVVWPSYTMLYLDNTDKIVAELKRRNLFLFDLWGYVPGSGPGGYWQQFHPPQQVLQLFENELGDHWLGMDNGEQDGRYVGGFASQMFPVGADRMHQYFNFQNHFQGLTDELGNKMATLVSLNFGHYFLKEGIYTFIGAETAQGLPNAQVYYSFIRGASKQYGVPWFGNASVWNRWGEYKTYGKTTAKNAGPDKGTSLSLLKRLMYSHIFYNSFMVGFESGFISENKLTPIGKIQQSARQWLQNFGQPGNMLTPVALMADFYSGWSFPRHLYSGEIYKVWGNLPYEEGDYLTNDVLEMLYPGYQNSSYYHNEKGFNVETPYGDILDCLLSDTPGWLLKRYPVLVLAGDIHGDLELKDKLEEYVRAGGHLVITAGSLKRFPGKLLGFQVIHSPAAFNPGTNVHFEGHSISEPGPFSLCNLNYPEQTRIIARCGEMPAVLEYGPGKGKMTVIASPYGIPDAPVQTDIKSEIDRDLPNPFPLLDHVHIVLDEIFTSQQLFDSGEGLSCITCRKSAGVYNLLVCNNTWEEKPLHIQSRIGEILSVKESRLDRSELKAIGYLPTGFSDLQTGRDDKSHIAGGSVRVFTVKVKERNVEVIPHKVPEKYETNRLLNLRNVGDIKKAIRSRPTFFQHFSGVVIDWEYADIRGDKALVRESGWLKHQRLKIIVDFTSGLNLFPDLRIVDNDSMVYAESMERIRSVIDKMALLGSRDLILSLHRTVENNFTNKDFYASFENTLNELADYCKSRNINIHLRLPMKRPLTLNRAVSIIEKPGKDNLYIIPGTACLTGRNFQDIPSGLKPEQVQLLSLSWIRKDSYGQFYDENAPVSTSNQPDLIRKLMQGFPDAALIFDGNYGDWDDVYTDIRWIKKLR